MGHDDDCPDHGRQTDLNAHTGFRTAEQGAAIVVRLATLDADGPTGAYLEDAGSIGW
ncbi:hypothetical protein [Nonomuraea sp. NPDC001023]|uniref:hypothetical protein n=1 Tax=unclassified Nonomuraea TaxID=2593643 RepID=UPI00331C4955